MVLGQSRWPSGRPWVSTGTLHGYDVFTIDVPAVSEEAEPLLVLHGFPTSSFDFRPVVGHLAHRRRVLFLDFVGFGFSAKPDIRYSIEMHADVTMAFMGDVGVSEFSLLTHDMGDTVGGELLARHFEGRWPVDIVRRVLTNGSIYIEDAHLSDGQLLLLSLPDAALDLPAVVDGAAMAAALTATFSPGAEVEPGELAGACELIGHGNGQLLLPRTHPLHRGPPPEPGPLHRGHRKSPVAAGGGVGARRSHCRVVDADTVAGGAPRCRAPPSGRGGALPDDGIARGLRPRRRDRHRLSAPDRAVRQLHQRNDPHGGVGARGVVACWVHFRPTGLSRCFDRTPADFPCTANHYVRIATWFNPVHPGDSTLFGSGPVRSRQKYEAMSSCDQAGCRTAVRGLNSTM